VKLVSVIEEDWMRDERGPEINLVDLGTLRQTAGRAPLSQSRLFRLSM